MSPLPGFHGRAQRVAEGRLRQRHPLRRTARKRARQAKKRKPKPEQIVTKNLGNCTRFNHNSQSLKSIRPAAIRKQRHHASANIQSYKNVSVPGEREARRACRSTPTRPASRRLSARESYSPDRRRPTSAFTPSHSGASGAASAPLSSCAIFRLIPCHSVKGTDRAPEWPRAACFHCGPPPASRLSPARAEGPLQRSPGPAPGKGRRKFAGCRSATTPRVICVPRHQWVCIMRPREQRSTTPMAAAVRLSRLGASESAVGKLQFLLQAVVLVERTLYVEPCARVDQLGV